MLTNPLNHLHPVIGHFPIVLLIVSVALDIWGLWQPSVRQTAWLALLFGTLMAVPTTITGIIRTFPTRVQP